MLISFPHNLNLCSDSQDTCFLWNVFEAVLHDFETLLGYKFVSYIHEMEKSHKNSITIYGSTGHLQSLDVTLLH